MQPLSCGTTEIILTSLASFTFLFFFLSFFPPNPPRFRSLLRSGCATTLHPLAYISWFPRGACRKHTAPSHCENCCFLFLLYFSFFYPSAQLKARRLLSCSVVFKTNQPRLLQIISTSWMLKLRLLLCSIMRGGKFHLSYDLLIFFPAPWSCELREII